MRRITCRGMVDKYKGKFDQGWDKLREETFERQKELGVIPNDCAAHHVESRDPRVGHDLAGDEAGARARRWRSTPASWSTPTTTSGLLVDALERSGHPDDTLIYVIIGDNGASAEGSLQGTFNEMITLTGFGELETPEFL